MPKRKPSSSSTSRKAPPGPTRLTQSQAHVDSARPCHVASCRAHSRTTDARTSGSPTTHYDGMAVGRALRHSGWLTAGGNQLEQCYARALLFKYRMSSRTLRGMRLFGRSKRLTEDDESREPVEQIRLLSEEVNRQLTDVAQRESGLQTSSGVLIAASSVLTSVQFKDWESYWQIISTVLFILAAIIGVASLYPRGSVMADATRFVRERLTADSYSTQYSIVMDKIGVLESACRQLHRKERLVLLGYVVLVAAWLVMLIIAWITVRFMWRSA